MRQERRARHSKRQALENLPDKVGRLTFLFLIALILISARLWQLSIVESDERSEKARRPQRKEVIVPAQRGTIRDRFNKPMAINKISYQAAVIYSQLQQIPAFKSVKNSDGTIRRVAARKEYISQLSQLLAKELNMQVDRIEDLIHSKAALYHQVPFVIKYDISEKEYYRLKGLEREWIGLQVLQKPMRYYPLGNVASDLLGFLGAIDRKSHEELLGQVKTLRSHLQRYERGEEEAPPAPFETIDDAYARLEELTERAYSINDQIGKAGIEASCEELLRGYYGKEVYSSDAKGALVSKLPGGRKALPGQRILLTISSELQQFCEELLISNDQQRQMRVSKAGSLDKSLAAPKQPWIKGGAIVALDPNNGQLLAMASYPRFNPNDFVSSGDPLKEKKRAQKVAHWFETAGYIEALWEGQELLERESCSQQGIIGAIEAKPLTWSFFLEMILPHESPIYRQAMKIHTVGRAVELQRAVEELMELTNQQGLAYPLFNQLYSGAGHTTYGVRLPLKEHDELLKSLEKNKHVIELLKAKINPYFEGLTSNFDKVLLVDLARLVIDGRRVEEFFLKSYSHLDLDNYFKINQCVQQLKKSCRKLCEERYRQIEFAAWRKESGAAFLKEKRTEEKNERRYSRPYIDLFDAEQKRLFSLFWQKHNQGLIEAFVLGKWSAVEEEIIPYCEQMKRCHDELLSEGTLSLTAHQECWWEPYRQLQHLLAPLERCAPVAVLSTCRSFQELDRPLLGRYRGMRSEEGNLLERSLAASFYPLHGFGFARSYAYRQATTLGSLFKLVTAHTALIQQYKRLKACNDSNFYTPDQLNPLTIEDKVWKKDNTVYVGSFANGKLIPQYYHGGRIPKTLARHLGKIDLPKALVNSSNSYFALLAGEILESSDDLTCAARQFGFGTSTGVSLPGEINGHVPSDLSSDKTALYATAIGQHSLIVTPLQAALMLAAVANGGKLLTPQLVALTVGKRPLRDLYGSDEDLWFQKLLSAAGIAFPLFTAKQSNQSVSEVHANESSVRNHLLMPAQIRELLLDTLQQVVQKLTKVTTWGMKKMMDKEGEPLKRYIDVNKELVGKSSTAESTEALDLSPTAGEYLYNHLWFGSILFDEKNPSSLTFCDKFGNPELVVVIYLRYGGYGRELLPLAAQVAAKWRSIKSRIED